MMVGLVRLLDGFYRSSNKISSAIRPRNLQERVDTYPLLSSDGYAIHCQASIGRNFEEGALLGKISSLGEGSSFYLPGRSLDQVSKALQQMPVTLKSIVIGDDDITPDLSTITLLKSHARNIYSVNLIHDFDGVRGIPLGLESPSYRSGGRLSDFRRRPRQNSNFRKFNFLVSWNKETNPSKRTEAMNAFKEAKNTLVFNERIAPQTVHHLTRRALFVPCPRGNGLDTHRVWETLYLGAIPVVLNSDRFAALEGWPILFIDDWKEIIEKSREGLEQIFGDLQIPHEEIIRKSKEIYEELA